MYPENLTPEGFPKPGVLEHAPTVLTAYGGAKLVQYRKCRIDCVFNGRESGATFFFTEADGPALNWAANVPESKACHSKLLCAARFIVVPHP